MKKIFALFILLSIASSFLISKNNVQALSTSSFQPGNIISNSVFFNSGAMNVSDIQSFLNNMIGTCDTNGTELVKYYYNPSTGKVGSGSYGGVTGSLVTTSGAIEGSRYATWWNAQPSANQPDGYVTNESVAPYVCINTYVENPTNNQNNLQNPSATISGGLSAAQLIYNVAQQYGINPEVILVTLQKEQGLITDQLPWMEEYTEAMGYNCSDTSACNGYASFYQQISAAAWQFQYYGLHPQSFNYQSGQSSYILYNSNASCGGSTVTIQNQATADLYNYTPYQPDQAALNYKSGTGSSDSCSSFGNINFWYYFNSWFGSTVGTGYTWSIQSFTYSGGSNTLTANQPYTLTLVAENTGDTVWHNDGSNPIRLGTWQPANRMSSLFNAFRLATMQESSVAYGQTGTFTFTFTPTAMGTFIEPLNLVAENSIWMNWPGFSPTIIVDDGYAWQLQNVIYQNGTGLMQPGVPQLITVTAKNTGTITWSKTSGPQIELGTWPAGRVSTVADNWISTARTTLMNEPTVAPGQTAGFQFWVAVPDANYYYEKFNLVAEGQTWMNDQGLELYLKGMAYTWQPVWSSISTGSTTITRETNFTITIKVLNTGDYTWSNATGFPQIRLGTSGPYNRGSNLYNSSWISSIRPAQLIESSVAPGQEGTFSFTATAPSQPGKVIEPFNLVAEGQRWFNSPDIVFTLNII
jgi:hypothetical protein